MHFGRLEGVRISLIPMELAYIQELYECACHPEIWTHYPAEIKTIDEMESFVTKAIKGRDKKDQYPFVVYDKELKEVIGSTRYLRISDENNNLSIGFTWYTPKVWKTRVNTETKYLLLNYAFEYLKVVRVEIITTPDNIRSQRAIERIGAIKEGLFRKKYNNTDYIIYSIIDSEWPNVKKRLEGYLNDQRYDNPTD